jgi:hypothetical protein
MIQLVIVAVVMLIAIWAILHCTTPFPHMTVKEVCKKYKSLFWKSSNITNAEHVEMVGWGAFVVVLVFVYGLLFAVCVLMKDYDTGEQRTPGPVKSLYYRGVNVNGVGWPVGYFSEWSRFWDEKEYAPQNTKEPTWTT